MQQHRPPRPHRLALVPRHAVERVEDVDVDVDVRPERIRALVARRVPLTLLADLVGPHAPTTAELVQRDDERGRAAVIGAHW